MTRSKNPVRVMHFIHSLQSGGAEKQLTYLLGHSDPDLLTQAVCCFNAETNQTLPDWIQVFELERKSKYDLKLAEISDLLSDWGPEIVHNWLPNVMINSFLPTRRYGKAVYIASFRRADPLNSLRSGLNAILYLLSDELVSNIMSRSLFFPFRQIFEVKNGHWIPNGFPLDQITNTQPHLPSSVPSSPGDRFLFFAGRLSPEKNIPLLLQAVGNLSGEHPKLKLIICGEGEEREHLVQRTRDLGIENRVFFLGYQEDLIPIMKACHLLVLPSFREGMSNVLFEALAAGLPVIASGIPTHENLFGNQEFVSLFDPSSVSELVDCIGKELSRTESEQETRRTNAEGFVAGMDIQEMVNKYVDLYHHSSRE